MEDDLDNWRHEDCSSGREVGGAGGKGECGEGSHHVVPKGAATTHSRKLAMSVSAPAAICSSGKQSKMFTLDLGGPISDTPAETT